MEGWCCWISAFLNTTGQVISTQISGWPNEEQWKEGDAVMMLVSKLCSGSFLHKIGIFAYESGQLQVPVQYLNVFEIFPGLFYAGQDHQSGSHRQGMKDKGVSFMFLLICYGVTRFILVGYIYRLVLSLGSLVDMTVWICLICSRGTFVV